MMIKKIVLTLFVAVLAFAQLDAQTKLSTKSKKAIKKFEAALDCYDARNDQCALKELEGAIKADENFIEAYLLMADIYFTYKKYEKQIELYEKAISIKPEKARKSYMNLGFAYFLIGEYQPALDNLKKFMKTNPKQKFIPEVEFHIACCEFALDAIANPVPFEPISMGDGVNTEYNDFMPSITADESVMVTTVDEPFSKGVEYIPQGNTHEDFYISYQVDGVWTKAQNMGHPINTRGNEGAQTLSADGTIMLFAAWGRKGTIGDRCDIFYSKLESGEWTPPRNIGEPINSVHWESQPSLSSDGKTIYFLSKRPGGLGGADIWRSSLGEDGYWQEPENLGPNINTPQNESSPVIHPDNKTLYFASNGRVGLGAMDLFMAKMNKDGSFEEAQNLGYPINSFKNDEFMIVNAKGEMAYFASERPGGQRRDIYRFELYPEARPTPVTYVKGQIYDAASKELLSAYIELVDLENGEVVNTLKSKKKTGKYLCCLISDRNYAFNVSKDGYLFHSENFSLKDMDDPTKPYLLDIGLDKILPGKPVVLRNIFFETASFELKNESTAELDKLLGFLEKNVGIKIEISGHTDNVGGEEYNQELSENRAKSVNDYLVAKGIDQSRLSYKGYGMSKPIDTNDTEEGRAANRRTEFIIVE